MPSTPEAGFLPAEAPHANDYDSFAEAYAAENENSLNNAYYERPATLDLAGDVTGRRILDAGCGSGILFGALRDRGAIVSGIDLSAGLLAEARRRLGPDADLRVADLADPLPFPDDTFDDAIASLVLHYLQDWGPTLTELHRVLRTGGRLIASVNHPTADYCIERLAGRRPDYFSTYEWTDEWTMGGHTAPMSFWSRPLHSMTDAFTAAGFQISVISEPQPSPEARTLFPGDFEMLATAPSYLFFVLRAL
jgi:SAM-dependent methyltransferase